MKIKHEDSINALLIFGLLILMSAFLALFLSFPNLGFPLAFIGGISFGIGLGASLKRN